MGIEKLTSVIISDANKQAEDIVNSAANQAKQMIHEENAKSLLMLRSSEESLRSQMEAHRDERISWARLESKRISAEANEDAISNSLEMFFDLLKKSKGSRKYKAFIESCVSKAGEELGQNPTFYVCKGEKSLLPKGLKGKVVESETLLGGLVAESTDGKFRLDMSFDSLFAFQKDELRKQVYQMLFEKK
ncbi:MAG: V-type ATP synthase subunit E [Candidatus Micrarchaeota archaeon]